MYDNANTQRRNTNSRTSAQWHRITDRRESHRSGHALTFSNPVACHAIACLRSCCRATWVPHERPAYFKKKTAVNSRSRVVSNLRTRLDYY